MDSRDLALPVHAAELAEETTATVRRWLAATTGTAAPAGEARLGALLDDPDGPAFALGLVDGVLRPSDLKVAGRNLERLSRRVPESVRWFADVGTQLAGGFATILPAPIVPVVREGLLRTVGHLLVQLGTRPADKQFAELLGAGGIRPMLVPVGTAASGHREANRQLADARELLSRPEVDAVSISLDEVVGGQHLMDLDAEVGNAVDRLAPLYELAATSGGKLINLDVQRLRELELAVRVFQALCELYPGLEAGVTLPAYLPESLPALQRIEEWAAKRRAGGGARIVVRLVKGDHLGEEQAEATLRGWQPVTFATRTETDTQFTRMLDYALTPRRCAAVHVVVATHNLFDAAFAWRLARLRGVERGIEHEFMLGIESRQTSVVKRDVGGIRLYTPVVQHGQLALAAPYLTRRLHDLTDAENFLSAAREAAADENLFSREERRFLAALELACEPAPAGGRRQDPVRAEETDFTVPANRDWAEAVLRRSKDSLAGEDLLERSRLRGVEELQQLVVAMVRAGEEWGQRRGSTRAKVLESAAEALAEWRGLLVEVAVSESGLTVEEADREVTVAVDIARGAAANARALDGFENVTFVPSRLIVAVPPRWGPIAAPSGAVLTALASGSSVILKTAPESRRSAAVLIETLRAGGVPPELLGLVDDEAELAMRLVSHPNVDRVILSGSRHTAKLFHSWRAELSLFATTGGRNSVIVTPNADLEAAVSDVVASAFDHAGQADTAASTVILVGSVAESNRFRGRLTDAVASLRVGRPGLATTRLSALARPAAGAALASLETLEDGESWLVGPRQLDEAGRLWSPGLRDGVLEGSAFHVRESRAPVLGIMRASSLAEAVALQNGQGFGLAAGIQSLDAAEVSEWLESAAAGMLFVNRAIAPGPRSHLPFGGWNRSQIGIGWKSGGPNELVALGGWEPVFAEPGSSVTITGISEPVAALIEASQPSMSFLEFDGVLAGAQSDERAWRSEFSVEHDLTGPGAERNVFRYRPVPVTIRLAEGAAPAQLVRVLAAAALAGSVVAVSSAVPLHAGLIAVFGGARPPVGVAEVVIESDTRWHARAQAGGVATTRIRLVGGDARVLARVLHGRPGIAVHSGPVTTSGRLELLPFLREQSISMMALRYGYPNPGVAGR